MFLVWGNCIFSLLNGFWSYFVSTRCTDHAFCHHPVVRWEFSWIATCGSKQLAKSCDAARHSSFEQLQGKSCICHIKLAVISGALSSLNFLCIFFLGLCYCYTPCLSVCSVVAVPWGSDSFILLNFCLPPFWGQMYYECLKLVFPPVSISYSFSATYEQRMWETASVSVWENGLLLLISDPPFYQSTSTYLSMNSGASTDPTKNRHTVKSLILLQWTKKRMHYI